MRVLEDRIGAVSELLLEFLLEAMAEKGEHTFGLPNEQVELMESVVDALQRLHQRFHVLVIATIQVRLVHDD